MALSTFTIFRRANSPIVAAAIHHGHDTRPDLDPLLGLSEEERLREEDPFTGEWTQVAETQIISLRSRFEVDLNRPRDKAVYLSSEDAWGLTVWKSPLDTDQVQASLEQYEDFYRKVYSLLRELVSKHGRIVIYDLHTYNHRRDGVNAPYADAAGNPEVNVGTGTMDRRYWSPVVERFIADLRAYRFFGRHLDVRENVRFRGGHFGRWIHETFPRQAVALAIEVKKFFMDEWSGAPDLAVVNEIYQALRTTVPGVRETLSRL